MNTHMGSILFLITFMFLIYLSSTGRLGAIATQIKSGTPNDLSTRGNPVTDLGNAISGLNPLKAKSNLPATAPGNVLPNQPSIFGPIGNATGIPGTVVVPDSNGVGGVNG